MSADLREKLHQLECDAAEARRDSDILAAVLAEEDAHRIRARLDSLEGAPVGLEDDGIGTQLPAVAAHEPGS